MKFVDQKEFENTLVKNITPWKKKFDINIVIASGMVGAKQGLEAYMTTKLVSQTGL